MQIVEQTNAYLNNIYLLTNAANGGWYLIMITTFYITGTQDILKKISAWFRVKNANNRTDNCLFQY